MVDMMGGNELVEREVQFRVKEGKRQESTKSLDLYHFCLILGYI